MFLPQWWQDISDSNPDGPQTFVDGRLDEPGVLQVSSVTYISGEKPDADFQGLIKMSETLGLNNQFGTVVNRSFGTCRIGKYGMVEFSGHKFPYISVWHLTNGKDFVFAIFICSRNPEASEVDEVKEMLLNIKKKVSLF